MPDLREKVLALADSVDDMTTNRNFARAVAALVLNDYAERMERAGQPAAALGAVLLAETLK